MAPPSNDLPAALSESFPFVRTLTGWVSGLPSNYYFNKAGTAAQTFSTDYFGTLGGEAERFRSSQVAFGANGVGSITLTAVNDGVTGPIGWKSGNVYLLFDEKGQPPFVVGDFIQCAIKVSASSFLWPVFWMTDRTTQPPEIDIFETFETVTHGFASTYHYAYVYDVNGVRTASNQRNTGTLTVSNINDWNLYGCHLRTDYTYDMYLNGENAGTVTALSGPTGAKFGVFMSLLTRTGITGGPYTMETGPVKVWSPATRRPTYLSVAKAA